MKTFLGSTFVLKINKLYIRIYVRRLQGENAQGINGGN